MLESDTKTKMVKYIDALPMGKAVKYPVEGAYGTVGTPDILACVNSRMIVIEGKRTSKEQPTAIQRYQLRKWIEAGAYGMVAWTLEQIIEAVEGGLK